MGTESEETARLFVLDGIHRGAAMEIGDRALTVGSRPECDAMLTDERVDGCLVSVSRDGTGRIAVDLVEGEARVGGRKLKPGRAQVMRDGAVLELGRVRLGTGDDLRSAWRSVNRRRRGRTLMQYGGVAAAAALLLVAVVGTTSGPAGAHGLAKRIVPALPVQSAGNASDTALTDLRDRIRAQDLDGSISVDLARERGSIRARGAVTPDERARWKEVARWFDGRHGGTVMLDAQLGERDANVVLPFRIVSLKPDPFPGVFIQDGRSFPVGSVLPGGWEVTGVDGMTVTLTRGERKLTIAF